MRKRLRKKQRRGEFREYGFAVAFEVSDSSDWNGVFTAFIEEAIEANGLLSGVSASLKNMTIELPRGSATDQHRELVRAWLQLRSGVADIRIGELRDAWHGWKESDWG